MFGSEGVAAMDEIVKRVNELIDLYNTPIPVIEKTGPPKFCMGVGTILLTILFEP